MILFKIFQIKGINIFVINIEFIGDCSLMVEHWSVDPMVASSNLVIRPFLL